MAELKLSNGMVALIDAEDVERCSVHAWDCIPQSASKLKFRVRGRSIGKGLSKDKRFYLHRFVLDMPDPVMQVDHINGDPLDNRKSNLRLVNSHQNQRNRGKNKNNKTGYKGVSYSKQLYYVAQLQVGDKRYSKRFKDPVLAAEQYDKWALQYHGETCVTNFSKDLYE